MATTTSTVLPGAGWMLSWVEGGTVRHSPVVAWLVFNVQIGALPIVVRSGAVTATAVRDPFGDGDVLWHPTVTTREQVEQQLLARAEGTDR
jgi:hypothetical protein